MSSIARTLIGKTGLAGALAIAVPAALADEAAAQDESAEPEPAGDDAADGAGADGNADAPGSPFIIDLAITKPRPQSDRLLEEDCEEEADAARISNEIIVCRQLGEASDGSWDGEAWRQAYAARTQGEQPVDVAGGGIFRGPATIAGLCVIPPCPPEAALMIDVEALPEAPEGSDADRVARGLPPLGRDEPSAAEIAARRRALGLDAPPVPGE